MSISLALMMLVAQPIAAEAPAFPRAFHGVWDWSEEACKGRHDDSRMSISGQNVAYWESDGKPVEVSGADKRDVSVMLAMSGEGETWQAKTRFVLSYDGNQLFTEALPVDDAELLKSVGFYHRCPASNANRKEGGSQ